MSFDDTARPGQKPVRMKGQARHPDNRPVRVDQSFPWLDDSEHFSFPPLGEASPDGILCSGGNLSPGMLLSAYRQGIFPWFNENDPIIWWSPDPRFVLLPEELHVSATMRKLLRKARYRLTLDTAFDEVISQCSEIPRPGQRGTWITGDMIEAYRRMHALGYAHSAEAWMGDRLVGGLYGLSIGCAFFGESMFSLEPDASKAAFIPLVWRLRDEGFILVDSQVKTAHVESLGGRNIHRENYMEILSAAIARPDIKGYWGQCFAGYPHSTEYDRIAGSTGKQA
ncbi:MAG: leucyl/phenylalanyl-tRNA--protein transferase [Spirochaetes bacterium RIFOXYC1_FULL_54_7]|nr:MAG: leucyl/phenylalanyl-tRNA--protein transferase [Spirochaetes bacterium RIFOXYC1_FULL_54_7]